MTAARRRLLERVVATYDREERPVALATIADGLAREPEEVRECLEALAAVELVVGVGPDTYRPTITARELLELDVADERLLVVDPDGECRDEA